MIRLRNILCPVDFSDCSRVALEQACSYADQFGAALHVLHVHPVNNQVEAPPADDRDPQITDHRADAERRMDQFIGDSSCHCFPVVRTLVAGPPTKAICEHAAEIDADLIIMGTHSGEPSRKRLLGSVAEHVVRMARCDVLTVHQRMSSATPDEVVSNGSRAGQTSSTSDASLV